MNIKEAVATRLIELGSAKVSENVINALVEDVLVKRTKQVQNAITELDTLAKEAKKFKPDIISFDIDGKPVSQAYSKVILEQINKNKARITKIENSINKALDQNDFSDLSSLGDNKSNDTSGTKD
jgi:chromosome condensin MukBEF ATPase and DNA-binding subunit MukB